MSYILDTIDLYLATISFWAMTLYFLAPIALNKLSPVPSHLPVKERNPKHWSVFFLKWGHLISITLSVICISTYLLAFQELFPRDYEFLNLQWELKNSYMKYSALLIPAIFMAHAYYFSELQLPGVNDHTEDT